MKLYLRVRFISETLSNLIRNHNKSVLVSSKSNKGSTCISQDEDLKPCILVMKFKWCSYYSNIPLIYLLGLIFDPRCKLDMITTYLENYYNFLDLKEKVDIHALVSHIKSMFYSLYDEYLKFYGSNLNINTQLEVF